jgi:hypothetical protein
MKRRTIGMAILCTATLAACAPSTRITSNRSTDYAGEPRRLFVISQASMDFGKEFGDAFDQGLIAIGKECGATVQVSDMTALELDQKIHLERLKAFGPDAVLMVRRSGGMRNAYGHVMSLDFDVMLGDPNTNKAVWRANVYNFARGGGLTSDAARGRTLAVDMTNKMKFDQVWRSCPLLKE